MMYTFPNKLRNLAITFMVVGFLGLAYGFITAPSTVEEAKEMVASSHGDGHGESHAAPADNHADKSAHASSESHEVASEEHAISDHAAGHGE